MEHEDAIRDIIITVNVLHKHQEKSSENIIAILTKEFSDEVTANKLYCFVPMAFGFNLAKKVGVKKFPSDFYLLNSSNEKVLFPLANEHYFTAALTLAYEHLENGWTEVITKEYFEAVISHSAEINALNKALNNDIDVTESEFNPTTVYGVLAEQNVV